MGAATGAERILEIVREVGPDVKKLNQHPELANVRVTINDQYLLFNYLPSAVTGDWTEVERVSRGLVVDWVEGRIAARPFAKFFNLNEKPETRYAELAGKPCEITRKIDGSLGIAFWDKYTYKWRIITRGSFNSDQAQWAQKWLDGCLATPYMDRHDTYLFEITYPENTTYLVLRYDAALTLIGLTNNLTGEDYGYDEMWEEANIAGLGVVERLPYTDINDVASLASTVEGEEGWVARYEGGLRVKVKTLWYLKAHKLVSELTPANIRDRLAEGNWEGFVASLPDDIQGEARAMADTLKKKYLDIVERCSEAFYLAVSSLPNTGERENKKAFAELIQESSCKSVLFAMYDGKDYERIIWKEIV